MGEISHRGMVHPSIYLIVEHSDAKPRDRLQWQVEARGRLYLY